MRLPLLLVIGLTLFFSACDESQSSYKPSFSGASGEMVIIIEKDQWNGELGTTVQKTLGANQYGLPQNEPLFTLIHIPHSRFESHYKTHRNMVVLDVTTEREEGLELRKDPFARGQLVAWVSSPTEEGLIKLLEEKSDQLVLAFQKKEINRIINRNKAFGSKTVPDKLMKNHQLSITTQKDVEVGLEKDAFIWLQLERERPIGGYQHQISQGILIYYYDYQDTTAFETGQLLAVRDSVCEQFVKGEAPGSYMTTDHINIPPSVREMDFKGVYAKEIRGLWKMENAFMGGPFVSFSTVDQKRNRVVTVEGYAFAPQFNKREYLREVEAMIKSLRFAE